MQYNGQSKIISNTVVLYVRMAILLIINLFSARILLSELGVVDYGIYNIVAGVILLASFFNNTMSIANQRFICYEIGNNNTNRISAILSTCIIIHICISIFIIFIAETIGIWFINNYINLPVGKENIGLLVFQISLITYIISFLYIPFHATIISFEKMNVFAYISIVDGILKLLTVISLKLFIDNKLQIYVILLCFETLIIGSIYMIYCNYKLVKIRLKLAQKQIAKGLLNFIGWNTFGQISFISANQGINILINIFFNVIANSAMGIANQVNGAVLQLTSNFQTAFRPQIVKLYANKNFDELNSLIYTTSKISFFLLYIVSIPIILNIDRLLSIWLTVVPEWTAIFCILTIIFSLIEVIGGPLFMTIFANGDIKKYQVIVGILFLSNIPIAYICFKAGLPPQSALYVRIIISVFVLIYRIASLKSYIDFSIMSYIKHVLMRILYVILISLPLSALIRISLEDNIVGLLISFISSIIIIAIAIIFLGINKRERLYLKGIIQHKK